MSAIIQAYPIYCVFAAFIVGAWFGFFASCLMAIAKDADERIRRES